MTEHTSLAFLAEALPRGERRHWRDVRVASVVTDSRQVAPGDLFVAIRGVSVDGHRFVPQALAAGAVACVVQEMLPELAGVPTLLVPDTREALAYLYAALNGYPARELTVIGVTGTDGKTTTTRLIGGILRAAGRVVGSIDSVSACIGDDESPTGFHTTTPDAPEVQAYLRQMVEAGVECAVIESTSHGLAQHRVTACEYDIGVVTNITHEHLDYHGSIGAYRAAKAMLFEALNTSRQKPGVAKAAVLNADDSSFAYLRSIPRVRCISYGLESAADLMAHDVRVSPSGIAFTVRGIDDREVAMTSPLVGRYNVSNILAAMGAALALGLSPEAMRVGVAGVRGVIGRMERIDRGQPFTVIVDFAHTPNALENALATARDLAGKGHVWVVFGCAGLRDRLKRPWMGEISGRCADRVVITAEDPRTESLDEIMEEIAAGCRRAGRQAGRDYCRVGDRGEAIDFALSHAQAGDVVLVTGKGHERSMCFGTIEYPWSDQDAVHASLKRLGYGE